MIYVYSCVCILNDYQGPLTWFITKLAAANTASVSGCVFFSVLFYRQSFVVFFIDSLLLQGEMEGSMEAGKSGWLFIFSLQQEAVQQRRMEGITCTCSSHPKTKSIYSLNTSATWPTQKTQTSYDLDYITSRLRNKPNPNFDYNSLIWYCN